MKTVLCTLTSAVVLCMAAGCAVVPARTEVAVAPAGVVYVDPTYPSPGIGWVWEYHPSYGWGWHHPRYGWHRGWR